MPCCGSRKPPRSPRLEPRAVDPFLLTSYATSTPSSHPEPSASGAGASRATSKRRVWETKTLTGAPALEVEFPSPLRPESVLKWWEGPGLGTVLLRVGSRKVSPSASAGAALPMRAEKGAAVGLSQGEKELEQLEEKGSNDRRKTNGEKDRGDGWQQWEGSYTPTTASSDLLATLNKTAMECLLVKRVEGAKHVRGPSVGRVPEQVGRNVPLALNIRQRSGSVKSQHADPQSAYSSYSSYSGPAMGRFSRSSDGHETVASQHTTATAVTTTSSGPGWGSEREWQPLISSLPMPKAAPEGLQLSLFGPASPPSTTTPALSTHAKLPTISLLPQRSQTLPRSRSQTLSIELKPPPLPLDARILRPASPIALSSLRSSSHSPRPSSRLPFVQTTTRFRGHAIGAPPPTPPPTAPLPLPPEPALLQLREEEQGVRGRVGQWPGYGDEADDVADDEDPFAAPKSTPATAPRTKGGVPLRFPSARPTTPMTHPRSRRPGTGNSSRAAISGSDVGTIRPGTANSIGGGTRPSTAESEWSTGGPGGWLAGGGR